MANSSALDLRTPLAGRASDLPARFRERVLAALPGQVERIVLFGSQARGEAHGESDWDFVVFLAHHPTEDDERRIGEIGRDFDAEVQTLVFAASKWLARDELACNIRDHGSIIYGPDDVPMIERPVLEHARDALSKAERFAEQASQALPQAYETVVHNSYYAMFHAARAALLALAGRASTKHGRVVETCAQTVKRRQLDPARCGLCDGIVRRLQAPHRGRLRQRGPDRARAAAARSGGAVPRVCSRRGRSAARLRRPALPALASAPARARLPGNMAREQPRWRVA